MKRITNIIYAALAITLFSLLPATFVQAQGTPKPDQKIAGAGKRTDVYHVHFAKAALGKAVQLGDWLKTPNPNDPMPNHFIVLRDQSGDVWDYVVITHLGPKATVEAAGTAVPPDKRDLSAWHNDTFVNGPSWEEFTKALGIDGDSASKTKVLAGPVVRWVTSGSVYSVSYYRQLPVIVSSWKKCSPTCRVRQMTEARATC